MSGTQLTPEGAIPAAATTTTTESEFETLLSREFRPKSDRARAAVQTAVQTLAQQVLANTALVSDDSLRSIEAMIKGIDQKMSEQINVILHQEEFQQLESAWRGLHHLVNNTETD